MNNKNSSESRSQRAQNEARDSQGRFTSSKGSGSKSSSSSSSRGSNSSSSSSRGSNSSDGGRCRDEQGRFESCGTNNKK